MEKSRKMTAKACKMFVCLILIFGFLASGWFNSAQGALFNIQSASKVPGAGQMAEARGGIRIGLPQWHGQDFSTVPSGWISIPLKGLPTGWYPPRTYPLPRDLDRDFGQEEQQHQTKYDGTEKRGSAGNDVIIRRGDRQYLDENGNI